MKASDKPDIEQLSGLRKAAVLMIMIGDEASSEILKQLDEEEVQAISRGDRPRADALHRKKPRACSKSSTRWPSRTTTS